jgi:hypothetical protein
MHRAWRGRLRVTPSQACLLVTDEQGDLLKARLELQPRHPRALLTLLEGLSLWSGEPLSVALSADGLCHPGHGSTLFGDELWPGESPLVRFVVVGPELRRGRLDGLGDFRTLRRRPQGTRS